MGQAAEAEGLDIDSVMDSVAAGLGSVDTDDAGNDAPDDSVPDAAPDAAVDASAVEPEDIPMPQSWKKEWEPDWKLTPKQARQRFLEREKQMLDGLEGYKADANYGRSLKKAFEPYMDVLRSQGVDEAKAVAYLLNAHRMLSDPKTARQQYEAIAKSYNITPAQAAAVAAADPAAAAQSDHPAVRAALERIERVEGFLTEQQQREHKTRVETTQKEVDAFASDPAHPYFDEVSEDIAKLIRAGYPLADAYEKAVWANPVTRQKELGRIQKEEAEKNRQKALEVARQAKKGKAVNVKGRDSARASTEPAGDIDETLRETLANIKSRT